MRVLGARTRYLADTCHIVHLPTRLTLGVPRAFRRYFCRVSVPVCFFKFQWGYYDHIYLNGSGTVGGTAQFLGNARAKIFSCVCKGLFKKEKGVTSASARVAPVFEGRAPTSKPSPLAQRSLPRPMSRTGQIQNDFYTARRASTDYGKPLYNTIYI